MKIHDLKLRWIGRYSPQEKVCRLARVVWQRGRVGDGKGYSAKLTASLCRRLLLIMRDDNTGQGWYFILLGLRLHFQKDKGGIHV